MKARVVSLHEVSSAEEASWRELAASASAANVWLDPRFVLPALRWSGMVDGMRLVVVEEAGRWIGLLPVEVQRPLRRVPLTVTTAHGRFMTWHSDRRHPLIAEGRVAEVLPLIVEAARSLSTSRTVRIGELPDEDEWRDAVRQMPRDWATAEDVRGLAVTVAEARPAHDRPQDVEGILGASTHIKSRTRTRMITYLRGLATETGSELRLVDRTADSGVLGEFIALQARGWKGDPLRGGAGLVLDEAYASWFREVVRRFGADRDVSVLVLEAGGEAVAMHIALRAGCTWILFVDTYDERFQSFGPGSALRLMASTLLTWDGSHVYDSGVTVRPGESPRTFGGVAPVVDATFAGSVVSRAARTLLARGEAWRDSRDSAATAADEVLKAQ